MKTKKRLRDLIGPKSKKSSTNTSETEIRLLNPSDLISTEVEDKELLFQIEKMEREDKENSQSRSQNRKHYFIIGGLLATLLLLFASIKIIIPQLPGFGKSDKLNLSNSPLDNSQFLLSEQLINSSENFVRYKNILEPVNTNQVFSLKDLIRQRRMPSWVAIRRSSPGKETFFTAKTTSTTKKTTSTTTEDIKTTTDFISSTSTIIKEVTNTSLIPDSTSTRRLPNIIRKPITLLNPHSILPVQKITHLSTYNLGFENLLKSISMLSEDWKEFKGYEPIEKHTVALKAFESRFVELERQYSDRLKSLGSEKSSKITSFQRNLFLNIRTGYESEISMQLSRENFLTRLDSLQKSVYGSFLASKEVLKIGRSIIIAANIAQILEEKSRILEKKLKDIHSRKPTHTAKNLFLTLIRHIQALSSADINQPRFLVEQFKLIPAFNGLPSSLRDGELLASFGLISAFSISPKAAESMKQEIESDNLTIDQFKEKFIQLEIILNGCLSALNTIVAMGKLNFLECEYPNIETLTVSGMEDRNCIDPTWICTRLDLVCATEDQIKEAQRENPGTICALSHDIGCCDGLNDHQLLCEDKEIKSLFNGI